MQGVHLARTKPTKSCRARLAIGLNHSPTTISFLSTARPLPSSLSSPLHKACCKPGFVTSGLVYSYPQRVLTALSSPSPWLRQRCPSMYYPAHHSLVLRAHARNHRMTEEVLHESIEARTEQLISLRELGPPDLVHLLKQPPRNAGRQVGLRFWLDCSQFIWPYTDTVILLDRCLPPCHRCRCLVLGQPGCLH